MGASEARAGYGRLRYSQDQSELGSSKQKKRKRMSPFELSQIIVENGFTTRTELLEFAEELCGEEKNRHCRICGEPRVTSCRRGSSNSLGNKFGEGKLGVFKVKI